jgi:hypothetical protein
MAICQAHKGRRTFHPYREGSRIMPTSSVTLVFSPDDEPVIGTPRVTYKPVEVNCARYLVVPELPEQR